jgi:hypothetical protein
LSFGFVERWIFVVPTEPFALTKTCTRTVPLPAIGVVFVPCLTTFGGE